MSQDYEEFSEKEVEQYLDLTTKLIRCLTKSIDEIADPSLRDTFKSSQNDLVGTMSSLRDVAKSVNYERACADGDYPKTTDQDELYTTVANCAAYSFSQLYNVVTNDLIKRITKE